MVEDDEQEDSGAKVDFLRVQLSCLNIIMDGCQKNLFGVISKRQGYGREFYSRVSKHRCRICCEF